MQESATSPDYISRRLPKECVSQNLTHVFISLNTTLLHRLNSCYINAYPAFQQNSNNSWNQVKQQEKLARVLLSATSLTAGMAQQSDLPLLFHYFHTPLSLVPCFIFISPPPSVSPSIQPSHSEVQVPGTASRSLRELQLKDSILQSDASARSRSRPPVARW